MNHSLELKGVEKHFKGFSLGPIDLTLPSGCVMGLIGENGAGKSTLIKLILDVARRDAGEIQVLGEDNAPDNRALRQQVGVVLEEGGFQETLTVSDINRVMKGIYARWDEERFFSCVKAFSLPEKKKIKELSKGMKMKVSIAACLSHGARLLLLDEATSGLDAVVRDELLDILFDFIQQEDHSILISSHILSDLEKVCDYVALLHKGRLVLCSPKDELLESHGLLKCSREQFEAVDKRQVIGFRQNSFGVEALVLQKHMPPGLTVERPTMEEIMLHYIKEERI